jgi:hypothetical protein
MQLPSVERSFANDIRPPSKPKVFCIGFQKTGTSSLREALRSLDYRVHGVFGRDMKLPDLRRRFVETGLQIAHEHDAVEDMPWPLMFRELDAAFPGSRFILTVRDTDKWYASISSHFGANPYHIQQLTYGDDAPAPVGHEARYRAVYDAHNAAVMAHFAERPGDLLVMRLEEGDGWGKLCRFLGEPMPEPPFIHTNSRTQRHSLVNRIRSRLRGLGVPLATMAE